MSDSFFSGDGFFSIFFLLFIVAFVAILGMILVVRPGAVPAEQEQPLPPADGGGHSGGQAPELLLPPQRR